MTPDELYALGYALETSAWGVRVILEDADHMNADTDIKAMLVFHFPQATPHEEAARIGWERAAADFVQRRLANDAH